MAILIVQKGMVNDQKWRGKCTACGSIAECIRSDLSHIEYDTREKGELAYEPCPAYGVGKDGYGGLLMYPLKLA